MEIRHLHFAEITSRRWVSTRNSQRMRRTSKRCARLSTFGRKNSSGGRHTSLSCLLWRRLSWAMQLAQAATARASSARRAWPSSSTSTSTRGISLRATTMCRMNSTSISSLSTTMPSRSYLTWTTRTRRNRAEIGGLGRALAAWGSCTNSDRTRLLSKACSNTLTKTRMNKKIKNSKSLISWIRSKISSKVYLKSIRATERAKASTKQARLWLQTPSITRRFSITTNLPQRNCKSLRRRRLSSQLTTHRSH